MSLFLDVFESKQIKSTMEFLIEIYLSNTNKKKWFKKKNHIIK